MLYIFWACYILVGLGYILVGLVIYLLGLLYICWACSVEIEAERPEIMI